MPAQIDDLFAPDVSELIAVVVPVPLDGPFTYHLAQCEVPPTGSFVEVPFAGRTVVGVAWNQLPDHRIDPAKIKAVVRVLPNRPLPLTLMKLVDAVSHDTLAPRGAVLKLAMSAPAALYPGPAKALVDLPISELTDAGGHAARAVNTLKAKGPMTVSALAQAGGLTVARIRKLVTEGSLGTTVVDSDEVSERRTLHYRPPELSTAQTDAAQRLDNASTAGERWALLEGVPGSGKTEVYFDLTARTIKRGGKVLVLLPEIALSSQWLDRFKRRFGTLPDTWHSQCTAAQRRITWKAVARGEVRVLIGTRSALFLPFEKLDVIVLDEEHDPSFKQEEGVVYDARAAAFLRAEIEGGFVVACSSTPSLETVNRCRMDNASYVCLRERFSETPPPRIRIADLRKDCSSAGSLGRELQNSLKETVSHGRQAMLFLNRRGLAALTLCRACGYRFSCPNCTAWLTLHGYSKRLLCHHCGYTRPAPVHCPECGTTDHLVACGPGVEQVVEDARRILPQARIAAMTSDSITSSAAAEAVIQSMLSGEIDILVGTQLVAKGHHFPKLALVGIVDADLALEGGDPRAGERCFQLLQQLAGRVGRNDVPGEVVVQTRMPAHPAITALAYADRDRFMQAQEAERRIAGLPPFGRLAAIIVSATDKKEAIANARKIVRAAPRIDGFVVLGPAPAPLAMRRGRYRMRVLVKADLNIDFPTTMRGWLNAVPTTNRVRLTVDMDPQRFS